MQLTILFCVCMRACVHAYLCVCVCDSMYKTDFCCCSFHLLCLISVNVCILTRNYHCYYYYYTSVLVIIIFKATTTLAFCLFDGPTTILFCCLSCFLHSSSDGKGGGGIFSVQDKKLRASCSHRSFSLQAPLFRSNNLQSHFQYCGSLSQLNLYPKPFY